RSGGTTVSTALSRYVEKDDNAYAWEKVNETDAGENSVLYELKLTSQVWQNIPWQHRLRIIAPKTMAKTPTLALLIVSGSGRGEGEQRAGQLIADATGAPVAILHDVPNQPLLGGLREDALIAQTFVKFMETGEIKPLLD
ncbi:MAG: PhoPQ-activated protein PqaA family protein, partial [candidate division WOR-3 bacterium]